MSTDLRTLKSILKLLDSHKLESIEFNGIKVVKSKHVETIYVKAPSKTEAKNKTSPEKPTDQGQVSDIWDDPDMFYSARDN